MGQGTSVVVGGEVSRLGNDHSGNKFGEASTE